MADSNDKRCVRLIRISCEAVLRARIVLPKRPKQEGHRGPAHPCRFVQPRY